MIDYFLVEVSTVASSLNGVTFYLALSFVILSVFIHRYCYRAESFLKVVAELPGPSFSLPFIGNGLLFFEGLVKGYFHTWMKLINTYPHPFRFWLFKQLWVIVSEPKDLEAVFMSENATDKEPIYSFFGENSEGIFIAKGQNWKTLRSLLNPAFHTKLLVQFLEVMFKKSEALVKILEPEVGKTINIATYTGRCMLDIICGTQMGVSTEELEYNVYNFNSCSSKTTELIFYRLFTPHLHPAIIYKSSSVYKQIQDLAKPMHNFAKMVIRKRKSFLKLHENTDGFYKKNTGEQIIYLDGVFSSFEDAPEKSIIRKVTDILVAGSDTTQVATGYAILLMGIFQDIQEKVYQEQCEIFQDDSSDLTISTLAQMKYLEMVIKEVLRLYTIPGIVRKLKSPVTLENGVQLPTGSSVYLSLYSAHRNPKYWLHPHEFYPDHFLPENVAARPKYSFVPFSSGPRNCPGMTFGYLSMKTLLSTVVRHYKIHTDLKMTDFKHKLGFMLEIEGGYPVRFTKR